MTILRCAWCGRFLAHHDDTIHYDYTGKDPDGDLSTLAGTDGAILLANLG